MTDSHRQPLSESAPEHVNFLQQYSWVAILNLCSPVATLRKVQMGFSSNSTLIYSAQLSTPTLWKRLLRGSTSTIRRQWWLSFWPESVFEIDYRFRILRPMHEYQQIKKLHPGLAIGLKHCKLLNVNRLTPCCIFCYTRYKSGWYTLCTQVLPQRYWGNKHLLDLSVKVSSTQTARWNCMAL